MYTLVIWVHSVTDGDDVYRLEEKLRNLGVSKELFFVNLELKISYQYLTNVQSQSNHTFYRNFYINEFVQRSLCCNMVMIIFDLRGYGGY